MKFRPMNLAGLCVVEPEPYRDERGFLARTFCEKEFEANGLGTRWVQQNHTRTVGVGSVRGLHFQAEPSPEVKLVRCLKGRVWDVAVDVRPGSATFGQWEAAELSAENMHALYIPAGFAHGFQCLTEECDLLYLMSEYYDPPLAMGIRWDDPEVKIPWPLPVANLSVRDQNLPLLSSLK